MRTVLLVGSTGFIGSNLRSKLGKKLFKVYSLQRTKLDNPNSISLDLVEDRKALEQINFSKFDDIIISVGYSGLAQNEEHEDQSNLLNFIVIRDFISHVMRASPSTRVILIGSKQEYGAAQSKTVSEGHPEQPINVYGRNKLKLTQFAKGFIEKKAPIIVLRLSNVYGVVPESKYSAYNFPSLVLDKAVHGEVLSFFLPKSTLRDYLFIDDFSVLVQKILLSKVRSGIFNVGLGSGFTMEQFAYTVKESTGVMTNWVQRPKVWKDIEQGDYVSDISLVSSTFDWRPQYSIESGVLKVVSMYQK